MRRVHSRRQFLIGAAGLAMAGSASVSPFAQVARAQPTPHILHARPGEATLVGARGSATPVWGYDGQVPGPVLRVRQGDDLRVRLVNELPEATSVHWHGMRVPNAMDGVSGLTQPAIQPGDRFDYSFPARDAGTYWYHSHNRSWEQMARGLYGMLIVDEPEPPFVDRDLALVIDDWRLDEAAQIHAASFGALHDWAHAGRLGNWVTVNGAPLPDIPVRAGERLRLRLLNAANARIMPLSFPDQTPLVIALDGQPVPPQPPDSETLTLAPGQRVDLIVDLVGTPGTRAPIDLVTDDGPLPIAQLAYGDRSAVREQPIWAPVPLPANPLPGPLDLDDAVRANLLMQGGAMSGMMAGRMMGMRNQTAAGQVWAFNGVAGMPDEPLLRVASGRTAVVTMVNDNRWPHAMHLHGHHFQVIRRNGRPVGSAPWRDTELVAPGEDVAIAFVAGDPGAWLLHCHMLEHMAGGMVTWIEVV